MKPMFVLFVAVFCVDSAFAGDVAIPRWIKASGAAGKVVVPQIPKVVEGVKAIQDDNHLLASIHLSDAAFSAWEAARLQKSRFPQSSTRFSIMNGQALLKTSLSIAPDLAILFYQVANGQLSSSQVACRLTQIGVGTGVFVATPFAMLGIASLLGTASTGVAISSLSGAAATSAATAWLGGGAIAAGGGGMALGTAIMTGGAIVVAAAATYGVYKVWKMADPSERDCYRMLTKGFLDRPDLCEHSSHIGAALIHERERIIAEQRRFKKN